MTKTNSEENNIEHEVVNTESTADGHGEVSHAITLYAEPVMHIGNFQISNALFTSFVVVLFLVVVSFVLRFKLKEIPRGIQNVFEVILEGAFSLCDQITGSRHLSEKIFPIAISVFLFILVNNWLGLFPLAGFGIIENGEHGLSFIPYLRGGTADINTTIALSVMAVVGANIFGVISIGIWKTFNKYVNIKVLGDAVKKARKDPTVLIMAPITFFVGLIEIVGEVSKVASLAFRLFGNVFAGEVLLVSIAALMAFVAPIPFMFLEILVGLIQALIFSILLVVYFTISASDHDSEHEEHEKNELVQKESKIIISNH
ncbi:MAG: F0F1 ATP synthase subunit A [Candidatus Paceibacterota bacterium]|jgi:F-type H+-transporting ATPase subunit a